MNKFTSLFVLTIPILFAACSQETTTTNSTETTPTKEEIVSLPANLISNITPENAISLSEARSNSAKGEIVTFTGYIGGRPEPFTENRAVFVVADQTEAPACTDGCPLPWDACCTPSDVIAKNSATIQITNEEGEIIPFDLKTEGVLELGAVVSITGTVQEANESVFIVDASEISVSKE